MKWFLILMVLLYLFPRQVFAQTLPSISSISAPTSIPRFEKFEITFQLATMATNAFFPFDTNPPAGLTPNTGVTVNAIFTDPQGNSHTQPAFYYQQFQNEIKNNRDWFYPTSNYFWKVRFSPDQIGAWSYILTVQDAGGSYQSPVNSFAVTSSANNGFIRVSQDDPRYFEYEDGSYFPALGFNLNGGSLDNENPIIGNTPEFQSMGQNGIELSRVWISQFSIYGEAFAKWRSPNRYHGTQEPKLGILSPDSSQFDRYPSLTPPTPPSGSEHYMWLNYDPTFVNDEQPYFTPCRYLSQLPIKPNTAYRVRVRYHSADIQGPSNQQFGFAVKTSTTSLANTIDLCNQPTAGTVVAATYQPGAVSTDAQNPGWQILGGSFTSGSEDFINQLYVTFNNVTAGHVFIDEVRLEEASCTDNCVNLINKPRMSMHQYIDQRQAHSFDKVLTLAEQNNLYLKAVMNEKNDRIFQTTGFDGQPTASPNVNNFYGNGTTVTKVRWLQQAWWRYMQARWGYSPNIHSWELLNEGDPAVSHFTQADEFGKYMKCRVFGQQPVIDATLGNVCLYDHPNSHLVTTSFYGGNYPWLFWNNGGSSASYKLYRDVDYADQHLYANQSGGQHTPGFFDSALFSYELSLKPGSFAEGRRKPFIRGEVAWNFDNTDYFGTNADSGTWLHNFIWAGLNPGGLMEHFFAGALYTRQIYFPPTHDHRPMFKPYYDFIKDIPLNNGFYQDANATPSSNTIRVTGQKDTTNNRVHMWIQNIRHIWCSKIGSIPNCPQSPWPSLNPTQKRLSGNITISGLLPNIVLPVQWWYFDENAQLLSTPVSIETVDTQGSLLLNLDQLPSNVVDTGVKIGNYSTLVISQQQLLQNWLSGNHDQNGDNKVNALDFALLP